MSQAVDREAAAVKDPAAAAKLREKWTRSLMEDENMTEARADSLSEGIDALEDRYPEIMGLAIGEANDFARRSPKKGGPPAKAKSSAPAKAPKATPEKKSEPAPAASKPDRQVIKQRLRKSRSPQVRRHARSAYRQTGIPGATAGATSMVLSIFGMTVGLSLLYLLLSNATSSSPGKSAVAQISGGTAKAVETFLSPTDPLRSVGSVGKPGADSKGAPAGKGAVDGLTPRLRPTSPRKSPTP